MKTKSLLAVAMILIATLLTVCAHAQSMNLQLSEEECRALSMSCAAPPEKVLERPTADEHVSSVEREQKRQGGTTMKPRRNPWKAFLVNQGSRDRATDPALTGTREVIAETYRSRPQAFHPGAVEEAIRILNMHHGMSLSDRDALADFILSEQVRVRQCSSTLFSRVYVTRYNVDKRVGDPDWSRDYCYKDEYVLEWFDKSREYRGAWRPFLVSGCLNPVVERDIPFLTPPIDLGTTPTVRCPDQVTFNGAKCARRKP